MRRFRSWLVWLVVAAMPLQGLAAAVMPLAAGAAHAGPVASALAGHGSATAGHGHRHEQGSSVGADHGVDAVQSGACGNCADAAVAHGPLKCCGATCAMALAMTAALPLGNQARPPAPPSAQASLHPGVVPDGLDRPPRTS